MKSSLILSAVCIFVAPMAYSAPCHFELDKATSEVGWTAYKTTQKAAVNGTFKTIDVSGPMQAATLKKLLEGFKVAVHSDSLESNNPERNKTIAAQFFAKLVDAKISGQLKDVDEAQHTAKLVLNFNGQKHEVPMHYTYENNQLAATGSYDVTEFSASPALESLHKACEKLHMGSDGVSKTWPEVAVNLKGKISKVCK
jgi:hypothetical protein